MIQKIILGLSLAVISTISIASTADTLSDYEGYTIVWSGTITGYQDPNKRAEDDFEGCDYDRRIFLDDRYQVTCRSYSYSYSYRPRAVLLKNGSSTKLVVGDNVYDVY